MDCGKTRLQIQNWPKPYSWMVEDIMRAIEKAEANYLAGLGLMVYTEILGKYAFNKLQKLDKTPKERFKFFLSNYMGYEEDVKLYGDDLYNWYRNGLNHDYHISGNKTGIYIRFLDAEFESFSKININIEKGFIIDVERSMFYLVLEPYLQTFVDGIQKLLNETAEDENGFALTPK